MLPDNTFQIVIPEKRTYSFSIFSANEEMLILYPSPKCQKMFLCRITLVPVYTFTNYVVLEILNKVNLLFNRVIILKRVRLFIFNGNLDRMSMPHIYNYRITCNL